MTQKIALCLLCAALLSLAGCAAPDAQPDLSEPRVTALECLTNPLSGPEVNPFRTSYTFSPGELEFRIEFSKPMQRDSVESILAMHLGESSILSVSWVNNHELILKILPEKTDTYHYNLDLNGSLDDDGCFVAASPVISFLVVNPAGFYAYELAGDREKRLDWPPAYFRDAVISPDGEVVLFLNYAFSGDALYRVREREVRQLREADTAVPPHLVPAVWSPDSRFLIVGSLLYNRGGELLHTFTETLYGAAFAPGGDRVAVLVRSDDTGGQPLEDRFFNTGDGSGQPLIDCLIYDLAQLKQISRFTGITRMNMDSELYYYLIRAYWQEGLLIFEDSASMDYFPSLSSLDLKSGVKKQLAPSLGSELYLSPGGRSVLVNYHADLHAQSGSVFLYDLQSGVKTELTGAPAYRIRWSENGSKAFIEFGSGKHLFQIGRPELIPLKYDGRAAGWLDGENLLVFR